jgi:hypothetical protein
LTGMSHPTLPFNKNAAWVSPLLFFPSKNKLNIKPHFD